MIKLDAAPVFLIYFATKDKKNPYTIPMPIYLSERLTGLYVDTAHKSTSISTDYVVTFDKDENGKKNKGTLVVQQKGESQTLTVNIIGRKDSIGLNLLLPVFQTLYDKVLAVKDYRIAYFNGNILIFNARLASFELDEGRENNLVTISVGLEVPPETEETGNGPQEVLGYESSLVPV